MQSIAKKLWSCLAQQKVIISPMKGTDPREGACTSVPVIVWANRTRGNIDRDLSRRKSGRTMRIVAGGSQECASLLKFFYDLPEASWAVKISLSRLEGSSTRAPEKGSVNMAVRLFWIFP